MENIYVQCPNCQSGFEVPGSFAGSEVQCSACGNSFVVKAAYPAEISCSAASSRMANSSSSQTTGHLILIYCVLGVSLLLSAASLYFALTAFPKPKMETDPKKAVYSIMSYVFKLHEKTEPYDGGYFYKKNGDKILKSIEIKEIKHNGDIAVVFFKMSLGATEVKDTMTLYKTRDGYWIPRREWFMEKKCPEKWVDGMKEKIRTFKKDSEHFDISDI